MPAATQVAHAIDQHGQFHQRGGPVKDKQMPIRHLQRACGKEKRGAQARHETGHEHEPRPVTAHDRLHGCQPGLWQPMRQEMVTHQVPTKAMAPVQHQRVGCDHPEPRHRHQRHRVHHTPMSVSAAAVSKRMSSLTGRPKPLPTSRPSSSAWASALFNEERNAIKKSNSAKHFC